MSWCACLWPLEACLVSILEYPSQVRWVLFSLLRLQLTHFHQKLTHNLFPIGELPRENCQYWGKKKNQKAFWYTGQKELRMKAVDFTCQHSIRCYSEKEEGAQRHTWVGLKARHWRAVASLLLAWLPTWPRLWGWLQDPSAWFKSSGVCWVLFSRTHSDSWAESLPLTIVMKGTQVRNWGIQAPVHKPQACA